MTRLLVIGSSHAGALKQSEPAFRAAYPDVELGFFAIPGALFVNGQVNKSGVFTPKYRGKNDHAISMSINDSLSVDLNEWDEVLVVGYRFNMASLALLLLENDLLEGARTGKGRYVSDAFVQQVSQGQIAASVKAITRRLGNGHRVTLTDAPYPSLSIVDRQDDYQFGRSVAHFAAHPDAPRLFERNLETLRDAVSAAGFRLLTQPQETIAAPYATKPQFAQGAGDCKGDALSAIDHRHMNGDFGLALLGQYARQYLNLTPQPA